MGGPTTQLLPRGLPGFLPHILVRLKSERRWRMGGKVLTVSPKNSKAPPEQAGRACDPGKIPARTGFPSAGQARRSRTALQEGAAERAKPLRRAAASGRHHAANRPSPARRRTDHKAIGLNPTIAAAHVNLGRGLKDLNRFAEALASYDTAISLDPLRRGLQQPRQRAPKLKRPEDALASYDKAIALKSGHAEAHYNRAVVLHELKRLDDALAGLKLRQSAGLGARSVGSVAWSRQHLQRVDAV